MKKLKPKKLRLESNSKQWHIQNAKSKETVNGFEIQLSNGRIIKEADMEYIAPDPDWDCDGGDWYTYDQYQLKVDPDFKATFIYGRGCRALDSIEWKSQRYSPSRHRAKTVLDVHTPVKAMEILKDFYKSEKSEPEVEQTLKADESSWWFNPAIIFGYNQPDKPLPF